MVALGRGNSPHLATWATPPDRRRISPPIGCSWDCPFSPRRPGSSPRDPSFLALKVRGFSESHPTPSLTWAPAPRLAGSPDPRSSNDPPAPRSLAALESQAWSKRRSLEDCGGCDGSPRGSEPLVPTTLLPSHPSESHRGEHRLEAETLWRSLAIWEP